MPNFPQIVVHTMTIVAIAGPITSHLRDSHGYLYSQLSPGYIATMITFTVANPTVLLFRFFTCASYIKMHYMLNEKYKYNIC